MSIDLVVANALGAGTPPVPQPVQDQEGNASALHIATDRVAVVATPSQARCHFQFGNPVAASGQPSASLTFAGWSIQHAGLVWVPSSSGPGSLKLAFGGSDDPSLNSTRFVFNSDGTAAFPGLPSLPASGTTDLTVDPKGNIAPQTSSLRFKEQVEPLQDDFRKVLGLQPKSFIYKDTGLKGVGYAAEEVDGLELGPLVGYDAEGRPLTVHYKLLPVYLLELLKEQDKALESLRAEVAELRAGR